MKPLRQIIGSVNDTLKYRLDVERHDRHTWGSVVARGLKRLLALTSVIWHDGQLKNRRVRLLLAYDGSLDLII